MLQRIGMIRFHSARPSPFRNLGISGTPFGATGSFSLSLRLPGLPSSFFSAVGLRFEPPEPLPPIIYEKSFAAAVCACLNSVARHPAWRKETPLPPTCCLGGVAWLTGPLQVASVIELAVVAAVLRDVLDCRDDMVCLG